MKTPDSFSVKDWQEYLFGAVRRETGSKWQPKSTIVAAWTRVIKGLLKDAEYAPVDSFVLALRLDVIAMEWEQRSVVSPWEALAPGALFYSFSGRPTAFWRAVWFSRYAWTDAEVLFYRYHLSQWEAALLMTPGEPGRRELAASKAELAKAESALRGRPNPRASFKIDWLRNRFA